MQKWKLFKWDSSFFAGGIASVQVEQRKDVDYQTILGNRRLRIIDVPEEPEIRISQGAQISLEFGSDVTQTELDRIQRAYDFDQLVTLTMMIFDRSTAADRDTLTPITGQNNYGNYAYYFSSLRNISTPTVYANGVEKATGDATYGYSVDTLRGRFQPVTPGNWSGATMTAAYDWTPKAKVETIDPGPVRGMYPQKYRPKITCTEIVPIP